MRRNYQSMAVKMTFRIKSYHHKSAFYDVRVSLPMRQEWIIATCDESVRVRRRKSQFLARPHFA